MPPVDLFPYGWPTFSPVTFHLLFRLIHIRSYAFPFATTPS